MKQDAICTIHGRKGCYHPFESPFQDQPSDKIGQSDIWEEFDNFIEQLEPEIYAEAHQGDIDWKPIRNWIKEHFIEKKKLKELLKL